MRYTDVHNWKVPTQGDYNYEDILSEFFDHVDLHTVARDIDGNKENYTPKSGALFYAEDSKKLYEGDGNNWNLVSIEIEELTVEKIIDENGTEHFASEIGTGYGGGGGGYSKEEIQDIVGGLIAVSGNLGVNYDDANDVLTITTTALDLNDVRSEVDSMLTGGNNVTLTTSGGGSTITVAASDTQLSDSEVQTAINNDIDHGSSASHAPSDLEQEGASTGDVIQWDGSTYTPQSISTSSSEWKIYHESGEVGTDTSDKEFVDMLPARSDQTIEIRKTWCNLTNISSQTPSFKVHLQESGNSSNNYIINGESFNLTDTVRLTVPGQDGVSLSIYLENDTGSSQVGSWGFEWRWV